MKKIESINPYTNEVIEVFTPLNTSEIKEKIDKAHEAFLEWRNTPVDERVKYAEKAAQILMENQEKYAKLCTQEIGKLFSEGMEVEVPASAGIFGFYAAKAGEFLKPEVVDGAMFSKPTIHKIPTGVIFGITPWNYPLIQVLRVAVPNIMAGNVFITKHASNVQQTARAIEELFEEAGFPSGIYTNLTMSSSDVAMIIDDEKVAGVSFTGSERVGTIIAKQCASLIKPHAIELGGSDPFIVLEDADLEMAVEMAFIGRIGNCGQTCYSSKRILIHESLYGEFVEKYKEKFEMLSPSDPMKMSSTYAPMNSKSSCDDILSIVEKAVKQGAKCITGGEKIKSEPGAWIEPTIISNITKDMDIYNEELFGPVAMVFTFSTDKEALEIANGVPFGLGSSVISKDIERAQKLALKIETGMTAINSFMIAEPAVPFRGIKKSGYGCELGKEGFEEFLNKKVVLLVENQS